MCKCIVRVKKEQNKILFQNLFKLMFNKYDKQCKMVEGHLNSYFYIKSKFYKVCNDSKSNVCFNIVVGFGN
jgi:transglutaminase/protease-like cytokinesis protein 3